MNNYLNFNKVKEKVPVLLQDYDHDGTLVCLTMVLRYYGNFKNISVIRKQSQQAHTGEAFEDLLKMADNCHLSAKQRRIEFNQIDKLLLPAIIHWELNRFVVLTNVSSSTITIHDPTFGKKVINRKEANKLFSGYSFELKPKASFDKPEQNKSFDLNEVFGLLSGFRSSLKASILLALFSQVFILSFPFCYRIVIDRVVENGDANLLFIILSFFTVLAIFHFLVSLQKAREELFLGTNLIYQTTSNVVRHLFSLPIKYFESRVPGDIVSRVTASRELEKVLSERFISSTINAAISILVLIIIFAHDLTIGFAFVLFIAIFSVISTIHFKKLAVIERESAINAEEERTNLSESVQSIQTIKLYAAEIEQLNEWDRKYITTLNSNIKKSRSRLLFRQSGDLIFNLNRLFVMYLSIMMVINGTFTVGEFFSIFIYGTLLTTRVRDLIESIVGYQMLFVRLARVSDILLEAPENTNTNNPAPTNLTGAISISNLTFKYPNEGKNLIENLSLDIVPGEFIVLTGASGCGKTTLLKLILGLYNADSGEIRYDDVSIKNSDLRGLRKQFGTVMQNDSIFSGSIASNIALFDSNPNYERIQEVAKLALIDDVIQKFPAKYDTIIRQNSGRLSAGQTQRVILARALYKDPKVLFIDEGTAFLDVETEIRLNRNLQSLNVTRIAVAHRPESIRLADRIFDLSEQQFIDKYNFINKFESNRPQL
ncbi:peptidase domain-containing ABC transporter [Teredinibacter sp. KSP-S5-2]|uniref:peptidase domain-containing ABC transporter n=1 Tax=Teredinibacter sp. KSP-S5-2 TaxID=3034506 RepID=UPI002934FB61|nr:peptidase domain-containing ABC transporter [Teredinibacter sp. KSP-S5-2]WNO11607.1 peptidase domain-containing ABC transporter [Teredinibacter sp. KSP-S5-2]